MAELRGSPQVFHANTSTVDSSQQIAVGTRGFDGSGNEYIYASGVASTVAGDWVVFDENFATTRLVANEVGPVGIAMAAVNSGSSYGWYQIFGTNTIAVTDTIAADKALYIDGTAGRVDDAGVSGDIVLNAYSMTADTANVATVFISYPSVTDDLGGSSGTVGGADTEVNFNDGGTLAGDPDFTFNKDTGTVSLVGIRVGTAHATPITSDGAQLGTTTLMWSDLFLASGSVVNFNDGDVTLTHSANTLTLGGGNLALGANSLTAGSILANSNDVGAIGASGTAWSDLFLASGAVINFVAGDVTITHAAGKLTLGGDGAVEFDFANNEMTNVDIDSGAIDGTTIGAAAAANITGLAVIAGTLSVTATTTLATSLTGVLRADSGVVATDSDVTDIVSAASTTLAGKLEIATTAEITTGTSQTLAMTPGLWAQSDHGKRVVQMIGFAADAVITTGSSKAVMWVGTELASHTLTEADAFVTGTSSGVITVQLRKMPPSISNGGTSMLTTAITIDANENDSSTAATPSVIATSGTTSTIRLGDRIALDVLGGGTATGLGVNLVFQIT